MARQNIRLIIEYNGAGFHGWQKQPGYRTIQSEIERVLQMVLRTEISTLYAAGRTDAGVHARRQVANFFIDCENEVLPDLNVLRYAVSNILRHEVSILQADYVPLDFDSRKNAASKQYSYWILWRDTPAVLDHGRVWHLNRRLDVARMQHEASLLRGVHDFTSFRGAKCNSKTTVREIFESEVINDPPYLIYRTVGAGFLKQMVRNIVGTLVCIGKGSLKTPSILDILAVRDRRAAGITAPAYALFLDWVMYREGSAAKVFCAEDQNGVQKEKANK